MLEADLCKRIGGTVRSLFSRSPDKTDLKGKLDKNDIQLLVMALQSRGFLPFIQLASDLSSRAKTSVTLEERSIILSAVDDMLTDLEPVAVPYKK